jgi:hypothetical protein
LASRQKRAYPFRDCLQRPVPTTQSTQNVPEEIDARVRRLVARRREETFLTG